MKKGSRRRMVLDRILRVPKGPGEGRVYAGRSLKGEVEGVVCASV